MMILGPTSLREMLLAVYSLEFHLRRFLRWSTFLALMSILTLFPIQIGSSMQVIGSPTIVPMTRLVFPVMMKPLFCIWRTSARDARAVSRTSFWMQSDCTTRPMRLSLNFLTLKETSAHMLPGCRTSSKHGKVEQQLGQETLSSLPDWRRGSLITRTINAAFTPE